MLNLKALNDRQLEAVTNKSGNLLVLAGPGSGKTFTIIQRIHYLLEVRKVLPEKILVISFTRDSATELRNRFLESIKNNSSYSPVNFGTFHSIFYNILNLSSNSQFSIITYSHKKEIIQKILKQKYSDAIGQLSSNELQRVLESIIGAISYYKNTLDSSLTLTCIPEQFSNQFTSIYAEYEKYRKREHHVDFDDMVSDCYELLSNNDKLRDKWADHFSHILIDEFQDINPIQYKTIRLLMKDTTEIFVVGDDDQSIYGFRGASPECIGNIRSECNCQIINLSYNYRNPEEIRSYAEKVIVENSTRMEKASVSVNPKSDKKRIHLYGLENRQLHYEYMAGLVTQLKSPVAVLFRTNIEMQRFAMILNKKGIRYTCNEKSRSLYDHFIVKDVIAYLKMAANDWSMSERVINKPVRYINREALIGEKSVLENIYKYYSLSSDKNFSKKIINEVNILKKELSFINEKALFAQVTYIFKKIGYQKFLFDSVKGDETRIEEYMKIMDWILDDVKNYADLETYLSECDRMADADMHISDNKSLSNALNWNGKNIITTNNIQQNISLMTVHASKGLEFENVIIAECNEGNFPHGKMLDANTTEEERRLFYVAVTRSSKNLYVFYIKGTKERISIPSRFIAHLLDNKYPNEGEMNNDC